MSLRKLALTLRRGASLDLPIRVESDVISYAAITGMTASAPLRVTAPSNGVPDGWRACVQNAGGMANLNVTDPVRDADLRRVAKIDANTLTFPGVNAAAWHAWTSGGQIAFYAPFDLSAYASARMDVKDAAGGSELGQYSTSASTLQIDLTNNAIWLHLSPVDTLLLPAGVHLFDIELVKESGSVDAICSPDSTLTVIDEITT